MDPMEWLMSGDTGISSKTILSAMTGTKMTGGFGPDIPGDFSDFGRCYRLLQNFPEWRANIQKVAEVYPKWGPLVREWGRLESAYESDLRKETKSACYDLLRSLYDECMIAGGWVKTGPSSWKRGESISVSVAL
jgi:hypothetical protein